MANLQKIKTIARTKGITLADLADQIGITPTGLGLIIKANKTMTDKLEDIARVLGVRVAVFFDEDEHSATKQAQDGSELMSLLAQKDAIIAQKDKIIEQKDEVIQILAGSRR